jgi:ATP/maltotriose-dependent transcriptional regulator MalT
MNSNTIQQYNNNFDSKESYLTFRKEWRAYQNNLRATIRQAKADIKAANRALNTAQSEMKGRTPYQFYVNLSTLQNDRTASRKQITVAHDIFALVRNKPTRISMDTYTANPALMPSVLGALVKDGVFSNFDAIRDAIKTALQAREATSFASLMEKCRP